MFSKRWLTIVCCNLFGFALFFSWYLPTNHGFWAAPDASVFFYFNRLLATHDGFATMVALTNHRLFDGVALLAMGLLYLTYFLKADRENRRRMLAMGILMLLVGTALQLIGNGLSIHRQSPTLFFDQAVRVCALIGIKCKDASGDSFPGDHGMMMMIFSLFMLRYFSWRPFVIAVLIMIVCALPRLMSGAHWFSDIAVGAVSFVSIALSWLLLTPASDKAIAWIARYLPGRCC